MAFICNYDPLIVKEETPEWGSGCAALLGPANLPPLLLIVSSEHYPQ